MLLRLAAERLNARLIAGFHGPQFSAQRIEVGIGISRKGSRKRGRQ